jgi:hypothetical protein
LMNFLKESKHRKHNAHDLLLSESFWDFRFSQRWVWRWQTAFWGIAPCSLIEVGWRFRGVYCLHHCPDGGGSMHLSKTRLHGSTSQKAATFMSKNLFIKHTIEPKHSSMMFELVLSICLWR